MPEPTKPKCPECDTEFVLVDGKPPDECAKCKFPFVTFAGFNRLFTAAVKEYRKQNPPKKGQSDGFFDALTDLGRK